MIYMQVQAASSCFNKGDKNLGSPNLSNSVLMDGDKIDFVVLWVKARMVNVIFCTCFY